VRRRAGGGKVNPLAYPVLVRRLTEKVAVAIQRGNAGIVNAYTRGGAGKYRWMWCRRLWQPPRQLPTQRQQPKQPLGSSLPNWRASRRRSNRRRRELHWRSRRAKGRLEGS